MSQDLRDSLVRIFATTMNLDAAFQAITSNDLISGAIDVGTTRERITLANKMNSREFAEMLDLVLRDSTETARFHLCWYLVGRHRSMAVADVEPIEEVVRRSEVLEILDLALLDELRASILIESGHTADALHLIEGSYSSFPTDSSIYSSYVRSKLCSTMGLALQILGNYEQASSWLERAVDESKLLGFASVGNHNHRLASLLWASGQHREALERHKNQAIRAQARERGHFHFLVHSHLSAAKCAIDLKATEAAQAELDEALRLIEYHSELSRELIGYHLLYSGEIQVQRANFDEGIKLLKQAAEHFESLDPPHHPGALDAKIALSHFALYEKDYPTAMQIIKKLLAEAEDKNCLEARSRLLVLETFMYITGEPPLKEAFDDLVTRVHLINNPSLLLRALGNLYTCAIEFLGEEDQAFLLGRIKNLRPVLQKSCYEDIYEMYIRERYEFAIENRLERILGSDWNLAEGSDEDESSGPSDD